MFGGVPSWLPSLASVVLWGMISLYTASAGFWTYEMWLARSYETPPLEYGADDVQVRVLTVDAESVVQETVDAIPDELTDVHVVAESPIDVAGASVHVVPDDVESIATRKGRALEWARRHVPCEREFVLYLDEDTRMEGFDGLPDSDIVQFREYPAYTGSRLAYWAEIVRMGFQVEQRAFPKLGIPLYAWGGGIAVRKSVEDAVTWEFPSLVEDTVFVWKAVVEWGASFDVVETRFRNQAPPSVREMVFQRRRWEAGTKGQDRLLPPRYWVLYAVRNASWAVSPFAPVITFLGYYYNPHVAFGTEFRVFSAAFVGFMFVWIAVGLSYYEDTDRWDYLVFVASPLVYALHALGALFGYLFEPETFDTTEKVD
ncbi:glycosyltransferase family 2 protein [Salarchaeum japonicum]|uniref:Glycosyltransferase 2-like domain-containing protein n=1 Tax=Salarchaeum japonicum TaxID=555573 RepID=A0AAV3T2S3_9EURY|nr:glycosyltransferase family 2 protein [Salarchaeum japonicum]